MKNQAHARWLAKQLPEWIRDELISSEQAQKIQKRYPVKDTLLSGRLLINAAAAIMVGLGVIAMFAFNWEAMPKLVKLLLIFSAFAGVHIAGLRYSTSNPLLSESLHATGTMFMGAAIFLVSQIYHLSSHYPNAFILWSAGALLIAWAKPSLTQAFMALLLIISWHLMEIFDFNSPNPQAFPLLLFGILPLAWLLKSPLLGRFTAIALMISLGFTAAWVNEEMPVFVILFFSATLIYLHDTVQIITGNTLHHDISEQMSKAAGSIILPMVFLFTFSDILNEFDLAAVNSVDAFIYLLGFLVISQLLFIFNAVRGKTSRIARLTQVTLLLALLPSVIDAWFSPGSLRSVSEIVAIGFNLVILLVSIVMMLEGSRQGSRRRMVTGAIILSALVMIRFVDLFDSLVIRGIIFIMTGLFLFWISRKAGKNSGGDHS